MSRFGSLAFLALLVAIVAVVTEGKDNQDMLAQGQQESCKIAEVLFVYIPATFCCIDGGFSNKISSDHKIPGVNLSHFTITCLVPLPCCQKSAAFCGDQCPSGHGAPAPWCMPQECQEDNEPDTCFQNLMQSKCTQCDSDGNCGPVGGGPTSMKQSTDSKPLVSFGIRKETEVGMSQSKVATSIVAFLGVVLGSGSVFLMSRRRGSMSQSLLGAQ
mmetsp:Transcript_23462/g.41267  ORF Transcript_23462/g.41267 Transcript_23462/m.41267 type:complete len:215 (-) Transcript_23462:82-726(-)